MGNLRYVVVNENTLGYVNSDYPATLNILKKSVIKTGDSYGGLQGFTYMSPRDRIRDATKADFDEYNVSWKYHLPD